MALELRTCVVLMIWGLWGFFFPGGGSKSFARVWTMPVEGSSSSDKAESSSSASKPRLDKSKTERQQQKEKVTHILAEDAAKIFDDRLSAGKKVQNILFLGCKSSIFSNESLFFF